MAPLHSSRNGYGLPTSSSSLDRRDQVDLNLQSVVDDFAAGIGRLGACLKRMLSFPHLVVVLWILVLLWGERWIFASTVRRCDWDHWEKWPLGATPHRLVFVADPQIIDPHSYPGRPWPLNPLTMLVTDNYLRRSYTNIQKNLRPDTVMFLGDLFDGGREWKTDRGQFEDPEWSKEHRPSQERKYLKQWRRKYGQNYWLNEYARFGNLFFDNWKLGGETPSQGQRGRKIIASLPGNHDLGFGAEVKIPARDRFSAFFGEMNRVDVIGNHTFVSVDTVSLSADTSSIRDDLSKIYNPVHTFLDNVTNIKRRAVEKEMRFLRGDSEDLMYKHVVEDLHRANHIAFPSLDRDQNAPDLPTVLLSHVPLYRAPGTPCGPHREHWPPAKPKEGQDNPVFPDHRNAISVSGGYQYQNVLSNQDSVKLIQSIGNIFHAFSGDDHDYCEVVHKDKGDIREITVKSLNMAMGVPTPGFQMVSLYNPVGRDGKSLFSKDQPTLQTHLCLLPKQLSTFTSYIALGIITLLVLIMRAFLVPVLGLTPFSLSPNSNSGAALPTFGNNSHTGKAKDEGRQETGYNLSSQSSGTASNKMLSARVASTNRGRGSSVSSASPYAMDSDLARSISPKAQMGIPNGTNAAARNSNRWEWAGNGPRIEIRRDVYPYGAVKLKGSRWRTAVSGGRSGWTQSLRSQSGLVWVETWTTCWRVTWMVVAFYTYLAWKG